MTPSPFPELTSKIPPEVLAQLMKLRESAHLAQDIMYDGEKMLAYFVVRSRGGIQLLTPEVVSVPIGNLYLFLANVTLALPQVFGGMVPGRLHQ